MSDIEEVKEKPELPDNLDDLMREKKELEERLEEVENKIQILTLKGGFHFFGAVAGAFLEGGQREKKRRKESKQ